MNKTKKSAILNYASARKSIAPASSQSAIKLPSFHRQFTEIKKSPQKKELRSPQSTRNSLKPKRSATKTELLQNSSKLGSRSSLPSRISPSTSKLKGNSSEDKGDQLLTLIKRKPIETQVKDELLPELPKIDFNKCEPILEIKEELRDNTQKVKIMGESKSVSVDDNKYARSFTGLTKPAQNSNNLLMEGIQKETRGSQVKVVARFRPLNSLEKELMESGVGNECCTFVEAEQTVQVPTESLSIRLDNIYGPDSLQESLYDYLGKGTIADILKGYNGSIFAYGQTGSGKTFTMFGPDLHDEQVMGIIPRAAGHIFDEINTCQLEIDFEIRCSMLEIYKEKLQDLLLDPQITGPELKIKESPQKGIYIQGLVEECVVCEEELVELIEDGYEMRSMAETRANKTSSRSHAIFILQLTQKFPNGSEKKGRLNLIDLAGSEKVGKTGATGQALEEAKKINLSLSAIGNVIHALVLKSQHIPYRDSKLTRILQESLGGNYKTSLIVTCSSHSSQKEETITTLRFAQRARSLKNQVKMNLQSSPAQMQAMIDHLKHELKLAHEQISFLKFGLKEGNQMGQDFLIDEDSTIIPSVLMNHTIDCLKEGDCDESEYNELRMNETHTGGFVTDRMSKYSNSLGQEKLPSARYTKPILSNIRKKFSGLRLGIKEAQASNWNNKILKTNEQYQFNQACNQKVEGFYQKHGRNSPFEEDDHYTSFENRTNFSDLQNQLEIFKMKVNSQDAEIENLNVENSNLKDKVLKCKDELLEYKEKCLKLEQNLEEKEMDMFMKDQTGINKYNSSNTENNILTAQIKSLSEALVDSECECAEMLQEKQKIINANLAYQLTEVSYVDLHLSQFLENEKFNSKIWDQWIKYGEAVNTSEKSTFNSKIFSNIIRIPLDESNILARNGYGEEVKNSIIEGTLSPEFQIHFLRGQLMEAGVFNHNLKRVIVALQWRLIMETGKLRIKSDIANSSERDIQTMHSLLEKTQINHKTLRERMEKLENKKIIYMKQQHSSASGSPSSPPTLGGIGSTEGLSSPIRRPGRKTSSEKVRMIKTFKSRGSILGGLELPSGELSVPRKERLSGIFNFQNLPITAGAIIEEEEKESGKESEKESDSHKDNSFSTSSFSSSSEESTPLPVKPQLQIEIVKKYPMRARLSIRKPPEMLGNRMRRSTLFVGGGLRTNILNTELATDTNLNNNSGIQLENLEEKVRCLAVELELQTARADQMKKGFIESKTHILNLNTSIQQMETNYLNSLQEENTNWEKKLEELKINYERELIRKQRDMSKMHEQLSSWMNKYIILQHFMGSQRNPNKGKKHPRQIAHHVDRDGIFTDRKLENQQLAGTILLSPPQGIRQVKHTTPIGDNNEI